MKAIKTILVPTDFSAIAATSYRYALHLAEELSASLHLLHCLPATPAVAGNGNMVIDMTPQLYQQAEARLQEFKKAGLAGVRSGASQIPVVNSSVSVFGLEEGIAQHVDDLNVDLVIVGTHGVQDNWDRLFGTNTTFLVGKVKPPILIIPEGAAFHPLKSICFATDLRESDLQGADHLSKALQVFQPKINFLHVRLPEDKQTVGALELFRSAFEQPRAGLDATFTSVFNEDVTDGIFAYLEKDPHHLLVMVKPQRGWWDRWFVHSDTKESAGITSVPLLIMGE